MTLFIFDFVEKQLLANSLFSSTGLMLKIFKNSKSCAEITSLQQLAGVSCCCEVLGCVLGFFVSRIIQISKDFGFGVFVGFF